MLQPWVQVGVALGIVTAIMLIAWVVQQIRKDASIVDVMWSANLGVLALFYAATSDAGIGRRVIVAVLPVVWSFRLAGYLLVNRVIGKHEDGRYQTLRANWGDNAGAFFLLFFLAQGLLDVIFSLSFLVTIYAPASELGYLEIVGVLLGAIAIAGESVADGQLSRFRSNPAHRGKTCRVGLWRYSRHPNYFFEWLHWWSYIVLSALSSYVWLTLISPALMLFFLFKVTGIPATEAQAVASRGDEYRQYQRTTSPFVPWIPKREQP